MVEHRTLVWSNGLLSKRYTKREVQAAVQREGKKVDVLEQITHNTFKYEFKFDGYSIEAIRYCETDIVMWVPYCSSWIINTGGWMTKTTMSRINKYQDGVRLFQKDYEWYWFQRGGKAAIWYEDFDIVASGGYIMRQCNTIGVLPISHSILDRILDAVSFGNDDGPGEVLRPERGW